MATGDSILGGEFFLKDSSPLRDWDLGKTAHGWAITLPWPGSAFSELYLNVLQYHDTMSLYYSFGRFIPPLLHNRNNQVPMQFSTSSVTSEVRHCHE